MGDFKHRLGLVALAGALVLSGCASEAAGEPAADSTATTTAPTQAPGPEPVAYEAPITEGSVATPETEQSGVAGSFFWGLVTNPYGLSGQWTADGNDPAHIAQLWENYFSDGLKEKLRAAEPGADLTGIANWALLAVAPLESSDAIKASPSCTPDMESCWLLESRDGRVTTVNNPKFDPADVAGPNQYLGTYTLTLPVSLSEQDNAEGYMSAELKLNLTFVPNPSPGDGRPPYLIDSVNNQLLNAQTDLLSNRPELVFSDKR
ncbi:hypothetical protein LJ756_13620 [Arthrobacter sp. zg-Y411]|uniref:hypothetical protein n=1 Tax=Arthrobacter zhangbolii TaxID=2886936 RepID=UPI001D146312|nr:hypothetical protein [Arthrobacter zhangbolii]MCC3295657.1 hypothetical protein [Arthrobacter zhangbolii]